MSPNLINQILLSLVVATPGFILGLLSWRNARRNQSHTFIKDDAELDLNTRKIISEESFNILTNYKDLLLAQKDLQTQLNEITDKNERKYAELETNYKIQSGELAQLKLDIIDLKHQNALQAKQLTDLQSTNENLKLTQNRVLTRMANQIKDFCKKEFEQFVQDALAIFSANDNIEAHLRARLAESKNNIDGFSAKEDSDA